MRKKTPSPANALKVEIPNELLDPWRVLSKRHADARLSAEEGLQTLYDLATGSDEGIQDAAVRDLIRILSNMLALINSPQSANGKGAVWCGEGPNPMPDLCSDAIRPDVFARLARQRDSWPAIHFTHKETNADLTGRAIAGFGVGEKSGINTQGKSFSLTTPANIIVLNLKAFIDQHRAAELFLETALGPTLRGVVALNYTNRVSTDEDATFKTVIESFAKLQALSRSPENLAAWEKVGLELLPFYFGNNFEESPSLLALLKTAKNEPRWKRRDIITKAIKKSWRSVAAHSGE